MKNTLFTCARHIFQFVLGLVFLATWILSGLTYLLVLICGAAAVTLSIILAISYSVHGNIITTQAGEMYAYIAAAGVVCIIANVAFRYCHKKLDDHFI